MGNDFFDGLGETISRTARDLGQRAEQIYEVQKIRNKIASEERMVEKIKESIGNLIYQKYKAGEMPGEELEVLCEEISQHMAVILGYRAAAADMKGSKLCPSCEKAVDKDVAFCPYCGAPCPNPEPAAEEAPKGEEECCCGSECCGSDSAEECCCGGDSSEECCCGSDSAEECCCEGDSPVQAENVETDIPESVAEPEETVKAEER